MNTPGKGPPATSRGWRHVIAAAGYSMGGGRRLLAEPAGRLQCIMMALTLVVFLVSGVPARAYGWLFIAFAACLCVEALNTAIEMIVDRTSPEWSEYARDAKDLGSFAVFCMLTIFLGYAAFTVVPLWL